VVAASGRHLQRPLAGFLALDVLEVWELPGLCRQRRLGARQHLRAAHMIDQLDEVFGREDIGILGRPGGFWA